MPAILAWWCALGLTLAAAIGTPSPFGPGALALGLLVEALLVTAILGAARRRHRLCQVLQAAGVLAGLRNLVLAPVLAVLFLSAHGAGAGTLLALGLVLGLATVLAMAWLVRRYVALWRQALQIRPAAAGAVLLGIALALLLAEAALVRVLAAPLPVAGEAGRPDAGTRLG